MSDTAHTPENLARLFAENISRKLAFPDLEAIHHALNVLDLDIIRDAITKVYEPCKARRIETEKRLADPEYEASYARIEEARAEARREAEAARDEIARRFQERRLAGTLNPSMQARHAALDAGAL